MYKVFTVAILLFTVSGFAQTPIDLANEFLTNSNVDGARIVLKKVIKDNPEDVKALALLGDIAGFEKNWDTAMEYYHKLLELYPNNAEYNFKYGGAIGMKALTLSKLQAVIHISDLKKHLEKATALNSQHIKSRRALVELYMQLPVLLGGSEQKSQKYADELARIDPLQAALAKGYILKESKRDEEAKRNFKEAQRLFKTHGRKHHENNLNYEIGKISAEYFTDLALGLSLMEKYIQNYGYRDIYTLEWAYYRMAQIQAQMKNKNEAIRSIEMALSLNKNFEEALQEKKRIRAL